MIASIHAALSALTAIQKRTSVTANNIANVSTPGFTRSRVEMIETANGGVAPVIEPVPVAGVAVLDDTASRAAMVEQSNVDLAEEFVDLMIAQRAFQANIRVVQAQDQALGTLLDRRD